MTTCFLFFKKPNQDGCLSLQLDSNGKINFPLEFRSWENIKPLQVSARTILVISGEQGSIQEIELPWLNESKARAAIPFALEEQLAQNVTSLHFAFDRVFYQNSRYLVAVIDKDFLQSVLQEMSQAGIKIDAMTLNWFALQPNEACFLEDGLLVNAPDFKGALTRELLPVYPLSNLLKIYSFSDSDSKLNDKRIEAEKIDTPGAVWIAERLLQFPFINLLQDEFKQRAHTSSVQRWYQISGIFLALWLLSLVLVNWMQLVAQKKQMSQLDEQIAVIYKEFFPNASHVISPRFRIEQLLKGSGNSTEANLFTLLDKIVSAADGQMTVQQLRFQNQILSVTLLAKDFSALEKTELKLKNQGVKVTQTQASSQENKVLAILELSI